MNKNSNILLKIILDSVDSLDSDYKTRPSDTAVVFWVTDVSGIYLKHNFFYL